MTTGLLFSLIQPALSLLFCLYGLSFPRLLMVPMRCSSLESAPQRNELRRVWDRLYGRLQSSNTKDSPPEPDVCSGHACCWNARPAVHWFLAAFGSAHLRGALDPETLVASWSQQSTVILRDR